MDWPQKDPNRWIEARPSSGWPPKESSFRGQDPSTPQRPANKKAREPS